ncbi:phosphatidylinositol 3-kinase regulatory subunit alpha-like isoform X2 [Vespula squamosa]|uniref:Phosphatidylinositol 3-kinase regulatory subunit alpha-like isoform X2 n=1 Tax=Vespula squamosa TaxID=30214 RepID=A0ABD2BRA7_VESSQ
MLKGSLPPYLDARNEENSFYITLSNGPHTYVAESTNTEPENYNHNLEDVYFITPILCKHCEDYIWGSGKVGVACKEKKNCLSMSQNSKGQSPKICPPPRSERLFDEGISLTPAGIYVEAADRNLADHAW